MTPEPHSHHLFVVFGTRPEAIKLEPLIKALKQCPDIEPILVDTGQQPDLLPAFIEQFGFEIDYNLAAFSAEGSLNQVAGGIISSLDDLLVRYKPDGVVVQGDTISAFAAATAARLRGCAVIHVEAGLRTGDDAHPFPEELCRRSIAQLATLHCSPTELNRQNLLREGIAAERIVVTGNTIVDAVTALVRDAELNAEISTIADQFVDRQMLLVTLHRRENFGDRLRTYLEGIRRFLANREDVFALFPVHPNPGVADVVDSVFADLPAMKLIAPLNYADFLALLSRARLVVSDSGGIQEEIATVGCPLLILRESTERPEIVESGLARMVADPEDLEAALTNAFSETSWIKNVPTDNPFGDGRSGERIAGLILEHLTRIS